MDDLLEHINWWKDNLEENNEEMTLVDLYKIFRQRLRRKWDLVMAQTGEPGTGKSTTSNLAGFSIDKFYDLKKNVLYLPKAKDIEPLFQSLKPYQVLNIDEASKSMHKHKWWDSMQQAVNNMYDTERFQYKCTIINIPRFWNLTENFRNDRVKVWCHMIDRGVVSVSIKDENKFCDDPWRIKDNLKIYYKIIGRRSLLNISTDLRIKAERAMHNCVGIFTLPPMPDPIEELYHSLKVQSRKDYKDREGEEITETPAYKRYMATKLQRDKMMYVLKQKTKMKDREIGEHLGMTAQGVNLAIQNFKKQLQKKD